MSVGLHFRPERPAVPPAPFGRSRTDAAVMAFFARVGIDPADVRGYTVSRSAQGSVIDVQMFFEDEPAQAGEGGQ